jgi:hypothetical protein
MSVTVSLYWIFLQRKDQSRDTWHFLTCLTTWVGTNFAPRLCWFGFHFVLFENVLCPWLCIEKLLIYCSILSEFWDSKLFWNSCGVVQFRIEKLITLLCCDRSCWPAEGYHESRCTIWPASYPGYEIQIFETRCLIVWNLFIFCSGL